MKLRWAVEIANEIEDSKLVFYYSGSYTKKFYLSEIDALWQNFVFAINPKPIMMRCNADTLELFRDTCKNHGMEFVETELYV